MHSSKHTKHFIYPRRDAWFLLPGFLGFALWYLVPFGMSLAASVMENSANAHFAGLENYAAVMQSSYFRLGFGNTLRFFAVAVALSLVIGFLLANMIFWHSRRRILWLTLVLLIPIFLPTAAIVPLWKVMMGGSSWLMRTLKPRDADWKYITLLTLYLWKNIGAVNLLFLIGLQGIEPSVFDAASVDGASHRTIAIRIALPMLCTVTLFAIIYLAMNGMRIFRESYLLYGMYPPKPLYFIQNYVNNHFTKLDYGLLSAGSSLFALVMTGLFLCIWLFLQRKEDAR